MLSGHRGPVIDPVMWKRMYKGIEVYKGRVFADKAAVLPSQVREKIEYMIKTKEHLTITGASIILAEPLWSVVGTSSFRALCLF